MHAADWPEPFLPDPALAPRPRPVPRLVAIAVLAATVAIGVLAGTAAVISGPESGRPQQHVARDTQPACSWQQDAGCARPVLAGPRGSAPPDCRP